MGWIIDLLFGSPEESEDKKKADKLWQDERKRKQDREHMMSWFMGNDIDLINRQKGKKNWYGGTFTEEGGVHPKDKDKSNNDWWF